MISEKFDEISHFEINSVDEDKFNQLGKSLVVFTLSQQKIVQWRGNTSGNYYIFIFYNANIFHISAKFIHKRLS
jgi:hypothetical protein